MGQEINYIVDKLKTVFDGDPWYGDSIMDKINAIDHLHVNISTDICTKSVANLIQHMINWRIYCIKILQGDEEFQIELNGSDDWQEMEINSKLEWERLILSLKKTQSELIDLLVSKSDDDLNEPVADKGFNFRFLIEGIIQHDVYHLGQIGLVSKMKS